MAKGDRFWRMMERKDALKKAEAAGQVADSMEVRTAIMQRVAAGEITLEQAQAKIMAIKKGAKNKGQITRASMFR